MTTKNLTEVAKGSNLEDVCKSFGAADGSRYFTHRQSLGLVLIYNPNVKEGIT